MITITTVSGTPAEIRELCGITKTAKVVAPKKSKMGRPKGSKNKKGIVFEATPATNGHVIAEGVKRRPGRPRREPLA